MKYLLISGIILTNIGLSLILIFKKAYKERLWQENLTKAYKNDSERKEK